MALAILELVALEHERVRFHIDTGTNRYYQLKLGRAVQHRSGIDWVDDIFFSSPVALNEEATSLIDSTQELTLPSTHFNKNPTYAQLFSFKTRAGKSPAFSSVIRIPHGLTEPTLLDLSPAFALAASTHMSETFHPTRKIPCRSYVETYARQASLDELLGKIVKLAAPVVLQMLGGAQQGSTQNAQTPPNASPNTDLGNVLTQLLQLLFGKLTNTDGTHRSETHSLNDMYAYDNRFLSTQTSQFAQAFFWQAILQAIAVPLVQVLPQLMNAANQGRLQMKTANNKLVTDILSEVNRRMLLEQLLQAQRQIPANAAPEDTTNLNQLIQVLQQAAPAQAAVTPHSLSIDDSSSLSKQVVLTFVHAAPLLWNGMPKVLFAQNQAIQLKIRLNIAEPAPKRALAKAIIRIIFKDDATQSILYEKTYKHKNILPNSVIAVPFSANELSALPANKPLSIFAELRWLSAKSGRHYKALGSSEIVLVNTYFLKEQGEALAQEQELSDMQRFRSFWNKIWEAPQLDRMSNAGHEKKYLWELQVNAKYTFLLSANNSSNGVMETKILRSHDPESITERIEGRMKAGIELSITELNKLLPLWQGQPALAHDKLAALNTPLFAQQHASEFIYAMKLKGRAREQGMIWVVPVFKLFRFTLNAIQSSDDAGQITSATDESIVFPLPVSARLLGLKSQ